VGPRAVLGTVVAKGKCLPLLGIELCCPARSLSVIITVVMMSLR